MRKISMKLTEYQDDLEVAQQKGYMEGHEAGKAAANEDYSDGKQFALHEVFHIIGCSGDSMEVWNVNGSAAEVVERLQDLHKRIARYTSLSDIPF